MAADGGIAIGPILLGAAKPVHISTPRRRCAAPSTSRP
jgi:phosphotransacetylase